MAKRELLCESCTGDARARFPDPDPFPGEHVKFVHGKALDTFVCDGCRADIAEGSYAACLSIWADYGGQPYMPWEEEYIVV